MSIEGKSLLNIKTFYYWEGSDVRKAKFFILILLIELPCVLEMVWRNKNYLDYFACEENITSKERLFIPSFSSDSCDGFINNIVWGVNNRFWFFNILKDGFCLFMILVIFHKKSYPTTITFIRNSLVFLKSSSFPTFFRKTYLLPFCH